MPDLPPPREVVLIRSAIRSFFQQRFDGDPSKPTIGSCTCGVYAFFDYDGEPIYVGQTVEGLSGRVSRHLTGRRTDAVAKFVLDPFEVLDLEVWPMPHVASLPPAARKEAVDEAEYAVFSKALAASAFGAVLNEGVIPPKPHIVLPPSYRGRIIPPELLPDRSHPDIRLARRALTIASLARLISERQVSPPLRQTLLVQCQRLEALARRRVKAAGDALATAAVADDEDTLTDEE
jgi:hypothetical protein